MSCKYGSHAIYKAPEYISNQFWETKDMGHYSAGVSNCCCLGTWNPNGQRAIQCSSNLSMVYFSKPVTETFLYEHTPHHYGNPVILHDALLTAGVCGLMVFAPH